MKAHATTTNKTTNVFVSSHQQGVGSSGRPRLPIWNLWRKGDLPKERFALGFRRYREFSGPPLPKSILPHDFVRVG